MKKAASVSTKRRISHWLTDVSRPMTTRPDILHSVTKLAQRNVDPNKEHEVGAKRILRYLKGTTELKLHNYMVTSTLTGLKIAVIGSPLVGGPSSLQSKKQSVVPLSTTEAEYVALSSAAKEAEPSCKELKTSCA